MADDLTLYKTWDGMLARQDMVKAKRDAKKATIGPLIEAAKTTRKSNIEELRELRAMLAAQMRTVRARARASHAQRAGPMQTAMPIARCRQTACPGRSFCLTMSSPSSGCPAIITSWKTLA
jgi:hypothetical protein